MKINPKVIEPCGCLCNGCDEPPYWPRIVSILIFLRGISAFFKVKG